MSPETKKHLIYGAVIVVAVGGGIFLLKRYESSGGGSAAAAQAAENANAQNQEDQLAELAELGTSGASLSSVGGGSEIPVDNYAQELSSILQAAGIAPAENPSSPTTPVAITSTAPASAPSSPVAIISPVGNFPVGNSGVITPVPVIISPGTGSIIAEKTGG